MKAFACVLFAAVCVLAIQAEESPEILTLNKVMFLLKNINKGLRNANTTLINSPAINDLKDCCVASALECFCSNVINLSVNSNLKRSQVNVARELRKSLIRKNLPTCNDEETQKAQCQSCKSTKMVNSRKFVENFQTLLQKIYSNLV